MIGSGVQLHIVGASLAASVCPIAPADSHPSLLDYAWTFVSELEWVQGVSRDRK